MSQKKKKVDENVVDDMPDYASMDDEELDRQAKILKLQKEYLAISKERFTKLERERELCSISTALASFATFLQPVRDFLSGLPDFIQDIIPNMTPAQYAQIQNLISEQTSRLAQNQVHLTIASSRAEAEASSDIARNKRRRANITRGRLRDAK